MPYPTDFITSLFIGFGLLLYGLAFSDPKVIAITLLSAGLAFIANTPAAPEWLRAGAFVGGLAVGILALIYVFITAFV